jgi:hypothetical protein
MTEETKIQLNSSGWIAIRNGYDDVWHHSLRMEKKSFGSVMGRICKSEEECKKAYPEADLYIKIYWFWDDK